MTASVLPHCASVASGTERNFKRSPVQRIADIAGNSFQAPSFGDCYSRRDRWATGHAKNVAKSRE